jgi:uncharacterized protein (PEP-CTERM system associated)
MGITTRRRCAPPLAVLAVALALPGRAMPADWTVVPSVRWRETYSDNINLAPPGTAQGDLASELAPGITVLNRSPRLQLTADYLLQLIDYQHRPSTHTQNLQASLHAVPVPDWLQLDGHSSISRRQVSPFGALANDNVQLDDNSTEVRSHTLTPALRHRFAGVASVDLRTTLERVSTGDGSLQSRSQENSLSVYSDNGGALGWAAQWRRRHVVDRQFEPVDIDKESVSLRLKVSGRLSLNGSIGSETNSFRGGEQDSRFWNTGLVWTPSPRTSVSASTGRRFFGKTYGLEASHRAQRSLWRLAYMEDITTTHLQQFSMDATQSSAALNQWWMTGIPDPVTRQAEIDRVLAGGGLHFINHGYFLQKLLTASLALTGSRNTVLLSYSGSRRNALTINTVTAGQLPPSDTEANDQTRQHALDANWRYQASPRTTMTLSASRSRITSLPTGRDADNTIVRAGLLHQFQRRLDGVIDVRHARHDGVLGASYRENAVSASLHYRF